LHHWRPSQPQPLTDASPASARQPGLEVRALQSPLAYEDTHALFASEIHSFLTAPCKSLALHARTASDTFMRMRADSIAKWSAVRVLHAPPANPAFWRALGRRWKSSTYPWVTAGDSAHRRSLASFLVVTGSFGVRCLWRPNKFSRWAKAGKERTSSRLKETAHSGAANARLSGSSGVRSQRARGAEKADAPTRMRASIARLAGRAPRTARTSRLAGRQDA
jgi:hypothetical protein